MKIDRSRVKILAIVITMVAAITFVNYQALAKVTKSAQSKEQEWTARVDKFAKQRASHHYETISWNTRDLGGYVGANGKHIKDDAIFRSNALNDINQAGSDMVAKFNINKIIDLRSLTEKDGVKALPDPNEDGNQSSLLANVQYFDYPTNTAAEKQSYKAEKKKEGQIYTYGKPFTTYRSARTSYREIIELLLNNQNGAVMYHCLNGHDRTGLVTVVLLSALGVDKDTIYNDYLLTNYYHHKNTYVEQVGQLDRFYATVAKYYGNMQNYIHKGIGISAAQEKQLQAKYLTK